MSSFPPNSCCATPHPIRTIRLTELECRLLNYLAAANGASVDRDQLLAACLGLQCGGRYAHGRDPYLAAAAEDRNRGPGDAVPGDRRGEISAFVGGPGSDRLRSIRAPSVYEFPETFMRFIVRSLAVIGLLAIIVLVFLIYGVSRIYVASHTHDAYRRGNGV